MKQSLLVVLFAIGLPLAAHADSFGGFGVYIGSGTLTYPPNPGTNAIAPSFIASANWSVCNLGVCTNGPGVVTAVLPTWINGETQGGSLTLARGTTTLFQGVFTSLNVVRNDVNGFLEYQITGVIRGHLENRKNPYPGVAYLTFETSPKAFPVCSKGSCTAGIDGGFLDITASPEPSTLALLGTGILGIAGAVRKKVLSDSRATTRL